MIITASIRTDTPAFYSFGYINGSRKVMFWYATPIIQISLTDLSIVASSLCFRIVCNDDHKVGDSLFQCELQKSVTSANESAIIRYGGRYPLRVTPFRQEGID